MLGVCLPYKADGNHRNQWSYVLSNFGVEMENVYEIRRPEEIGNVLKSKNGVETAEELPNVPLVVASPRNGKHVRGQIALPEFFHPEECIYIFGGDNTPLSEDELGIAEYESVYIPIVAHELYSWQAGAVVLYDRLSKQWQ